MNTPRKYYFGNYPNSRDYDPSLPIGWNRWDYEDSLCDADEEEEAEDETQQEDVEDEQQNDWLW